MIFLTGYFLSLQPTTINIIGFMLDSSISTNVLTINVDGYFFSSNLNYYSISFNFFAFKYDSVAGSNYQLALK